MKSAIFILAIALIFTTMNVSAQDCTGCETIVGMIENLVLNNVSESDILTTIEAVCNNVPGFTAICDSIAEEGLAEIFQYISQNESPAQICTQLGLCSSKTRSFIPHIKKPIQVKSGDSMECAECEQVISMMEQWADSPMNQKDIITAIEAFCTYVPGFESTCDQIVVTGVPTIITWIDEYENSTVVCGQMELCTAMVEQKPVLKAPLDDCSSCQEIIFMMETYLSMNASQSSIVTYLEIACAVVPQWSAQCDAVILSEVPQIISWIEANETPTEVCTSLAICSSVQNLGTIVIS